MLCLSPWYLRDFKQPWTKWGYSNYVLDVSYAQFLLDFKLLYQRLRPPSAKRECSTEPVSPSWGSQTLDRYEVWANDLEVALPTCPKHQKNLPPFLTIDSLQEETSETSDLPEFLSRWSLQFSLHQKGQKNAKHENLNSTNSQLISLVESLWFTGSPSLIIAIVP